MIDLLKRIVVQTQERKPTRIAVSEFLRLVRENQSQITHLNTYKNETTQTEERDNVMTETLHLGNLLFDDPSIMTEWNNMNRQPT